MLSAENINCGYGSLQVLRDVTMRVDQGEIVCVVGANGAGKSTLLYALSGLIPCTKGMVVFQDQDISQMPAHKRVKLGISQAPEGKCLFLSMSVLENLELGAYVRRKELGKLGIKKEMERVFEIFPRLKERSRQKVNTLSGGEQQMVTIGRALMSNPKVLLLDEPSQGLSPVMITKMLKVIEDLRDKGYSILLVEQKAAASLKIADRGYVLETGRIVLQGKAEDLLTNEQVKRAYLGSAKYNAR